MMDIDKSNFDKEVKCFKGKVLLDFGAEWCAECKALSPIVDEAEKEISDVKFCRVDCDISRDLALEFNIMSIPVLMLFENGREIKRTIGLVTKEDIINMLK